MSGLIHSANAILVSSERRVEASANNIANSDTDGFKRSVGFFELLDTASNIGQASQPNAPEYRQLHDFGQGRLVLTGSPLDLAIMGPGFVQLRDGDNIAYSRGGNFVIAEGGVLADPDGRVLQQAGGGDLVVGGGSLEFLDDGTVLDDGLPVGSVGLWQAADPQAVSALGGSLFSIAEGGTEPATASELRQGFREASNVVMSDEMVSMMTALRRAEGGGRIVQFYDQLLGQAIQTFSRSGQ